MIKKFKEILEEVLSEASTPQAKAKKAERTNQTHAASIRSAAEKHDKKWKNILTSPTEKKYHKKDIKDAHDIADHVEAGDHKKAYKRLQSMDTSAKEIIPTRAYDHIHKHGYDGK